MVGPNDAFRGVGRNSKSVHYGVVFVKNLNWPGWTSISYLGKVSSLYVGYALKANQVYSPCHPDTVLTERPDREEAID